MTFTRFIFSGGSLQCACADVFDRLYLYPMFEVPSYAKIIRAFTELPHTSSLCTFFVSRCVHSTRTPGLDEDCDIEVKLRARLPNEFLFLIMPGLTNRPSNWTTEAIRKLCNFHEHAQDDITVHVCE